jgi:putative tryptophan/tyrosine transport system substrate-binding protein
VTVLLLAVPLLAEAQQGRKWRIGFLGGGSPRSFASFLDVLKEDLRERGYVEGQNITFEYRYADGVYERLPTLARELVRVNADLIVTEGTPPTLAARGATNRIPIVMAHIGDAVATGVVASLGRPGGNITGSSILLPELSAKRLAILKEAVPRIARVAVLSNRGNPFHLHPMKPLDGAAHSLGLALEPVAVRDTKAIPILFSDVINKNARRVDGLLVLDDPMFRDHETEIAELAKKSKLPSIFGIGAQATVGGLMNFGPNRHEMYRRAAFYIDKIFKGAKPADLPVEQPTKFDLIINLKTAKALGLTIPQSLLGRADQVIE